MSQLWHPWHNCDTPMSQLWHTHVTIVTHPCHNCDTPMPQLWHTHATIVTQVCHNCDTPKMPFSIRVNFNMLNDGIWFFFLHSFVRRHVLWFLGMISDPNSSIFARSMSQLWHNASRLWHCVAVVTRLEVLVLMISIHNTLWLIKY